MEEGHAFIDRDRAIDAAHHVRLPANPGERVLPTRLLLEGQGPHRVHDGDGGVRVPLQPVQPRGVEHQGFPRGRSRGQGHILRAGGRSQGVVLVLVQARRKRGQQALSGGAQR
ncbi:MAG: hypothetical protein M0Z54_04350 [Thermaerobacter sp.]|nr:hypothetical protein [Thermaerobacter sp.]